MITILIYLKNVKKPFEIEFENKSALNKFYFGLTATDTSIVQVGPLSFNKSELRYCLQK